MYSNPSGFQLYQEYYLYSEKAWEMAPSGVSFYNLARGVQQNAPIIITASGLENTTAAQPWGQISGSGKYDKVGYGFFHLLDNGQYDVDSREFSLHPDSSGKIVFNGILRENVYIEYEAGASGYYIMDSIDYNPIRNEVQGGFVHFSQTTEPASLFLSASRGSIRADGYQGCEITATLYDEDFDRVPEKTIVFEVQNLIGGNWSELGYLSPNSGSVTVLDASGNPIEVTETTNRRGQAHVHWTSIDKKAGIAQVKAYYSEASGIYDTVRFAQYYLSSEPFTLDLSLLDTLDYLT